MDAKESVWYDQVSIFTSKIYDIAKSLLEYQKEEFIILEAKIVGRALTTILYPNEWK